MINDFSDVYLENPFEKLLSIVRQQLSDEHYETVAQFVKKCAVGWCVIHSYSVLGLKLIGRDMRDSGSVCVESTEREHKSR